MSYPDTYGKGAEVIKKKTKMQILSFFLFLVTVLAGIIISLLIVSSAKDLSFLKIFVYFFKATIIRPSGILNTLAKTTPLLIVSLGLLVAFKTSVWNIGAEGQMAMGIIATLGVALNMSAPALVTVILAFIISFIAGGVWAGFAGVAKAKWNVPEIPMTLMQNFVAMAIMAYMISGPLMTTEPGYARTAFIPENLRFPFIKDPLNTTFLFALALIPIIYWLMNKSVLGYKLSATGDNPRAAAIAGLHPKKMIIIAMVISGGISALAGTCLILGEYFFGVSGITSHYGFYAIICVLLAGGKVELVPLTSFFVAFVLMGSSAITNVGVPGPFVNLTMGIVFIAALARIIFEKALLK